MSKLLLAMFLAFTPTAFANIWYVDGVNGNDGNDCKTRQTACKRIGHAISLASSGDTIGVRAATYTENLTIDISLKVSGSDPTTTIVDGGHAFTVFTISGKANVTLSKLTIRNGYKVYIGGGVSNSGTLTINNSIVSGNTAFNSCGQFCGAYGGGIANFGTLVINNSTVSGNVAYNWCVQHCLNAVGGGIYNDGTLTINNSTISDNTAHEYIHYLQHVYDVGLGGGIANIGTLSINNSTISANTAYSAGGGIWYSAILQNSIVANNEGGDCFGTMTSHGYNLSSDGTCSLSGPSDMQNTDPLLGPLQNNGGPTQTMALLPGSPAIDAGNPSGCTDGKGHLLKTDQRGMLRPDKEDIGGCDIGAYERQSD